MDEPSWRVVTKSRLEQRVVRRLIRAGKLEQVLLGIFRSVHACRIKIINYYIIIRVCILFVTVPKTTWCTGSSSVEWMQTSKSTGSGSKFATRRPSGTGASVYLIFNLSPITSGYNLGSTLETQTKTTLKVQ